jgi:hypothetical protein
VEGEGDGNTGREVEGEAEWKGKGIVTQTPGGDNTSHGNGMQLQKENSCGRLRHGGLTGAGISKAMSIACHVNFIR